jgi:hypothetical protein
VSGFCLRTKSPIGGRDASQTYDLAWWAAAFCSSILTILFLSWGAWWPALAASVFAVLALYRATNQRTPPPFFSPPARPTLVAEGNGLLRLGLAICTAAVFLAVWTGWYLYRSPFIDWILLAYPTALIVGWCGEGWLRGETIRARLTTLGAGLVAYRREIALLALIVGADLTLHLWLAYQNAFLHGTVHDESSVGLVAWRLTQRSTLWPLYDTMGGAVSMYQPLGWLFLHFTPSMLVLRLYAVPMAVAVAPAFYLLARQVTGAPAALCATALLALAYWPTMMGSLAFGWINGSVFQSLGLVLLIHGLRRWSLSAVAAAGMTLALCLYSYSSDRLMPIPAMFLMLIFIIRGPGPTGRRWLLSGVFGLGFLTVVAPWIKLVTTFDVLLTGDAPYMAHYFTDLWHRHPGSALGEALRNIEALNLALIARPFAGGYAYMVPASGGLIDPVTAALMLLGLAGAVWQWRRPLYGILLVAILLPMPAAAVTLHELSEVYRLNGMVPALFLAAALSLDQAVAMAKKHARATMVALLILVGCGGAVNVQQVRSYVTEDRTMCSLTDVYSTLRAAYIALAAQTNSLEPTHAVFVVGNQADTQPWALYSPQWTWLFQQPVPVRAFAVKGQDPSLWRTQTNPETPGAEGNGARFWPPRLGTGEVGITYFMVDDARDIFLPTLRADYPGGKVATTHPPQCAATGFVLTSYSLSAAQVQQPAMG